MNHLQMNDTKTEFIIFGISNLLSKKTLTQSQLEELQSIAQKQSNFLVPSWMKHGLLGSM